MKRIVTCLKYEWAQRNLFVVLCYKRGEHDNILRYVKGRLFDLPFA